MSYTICGKHGHGTTNSAGVCAECERELSPAPAAPAAPSIALPVSVSGARTDRKNGGEYRILTDANGAWLGDIRAEHSSAIVAALKYNDAASATRERCARVCVSLADSLRAEFGTASDSAASALYVADAAIRALPLHNEHNDGKGE